MKLKDADALYDMIKQHEYILSDKCNSTDYGMFTIGIKQAIDELPAVDAVPVVRCKDCKYSLPNDGKLNDGARYCSRIYGGAKKEHPAVWDVDYCSGGKKKVQE